MSVGELLPSGGKAASESTRPSARASREAATQAKTGLANCFAVRADCEDCSRAPRGVGDVHHHRVGVSGSAPDVVRPSSDPRTTDAACSTIVRQLFGTGGKAAQTGLGIRIERRSWEARLTDRRRRLQSRTWMSLPSIVASRRRPPSTAERASALVLLFCCTEPPSKQILVTRHRPRLRRGFPLVQGCASNPRQSRGLSS